MPEAKVYTGGCHCGAVRYEATTDLAQVMACNCSRCAKIGALIAPLAASAFTLKSGEAALSDYQFNKKVIHHLFCKHCGVESFARGKGADGSDMVAINVRCLDDVDPATVQAVAFNGKDI